MPVPLELKTFTNQTTQTMGKIISLIEVQGRVGNIVGIKGKGGRTYVRRYQYLVTDAKSAKQMKRRVRWANTVNIWKVLKGEAKPCFEHLPETMSDYNMFVQCNAEIAKVSLKKNEVAVGATVVAPLIVSIGSLPNIVVTSMSGGKMRTDIALGDLTIDDDTTVSTFSKAVLNNNGDYQEGDRIVGFLLAQELWGDEQIPHARLVSSAIDLEKSNNTKLWEVVDERVFSSADGFVASKTTVNGGICWIHSRIDGTNNKTLVSTQRIIVNSTLLETYMSVAANREAIQSYGGVKNHGIVRPGSGREFDESEITQVNP